MTVCFASSYCEFSPVLKLPTGLAEHTTLLAVFTINEPLNRPEKKDFIATNASLANDKSIHLT
jgi:hypothetical protein